MARENASKSHAPGTLHGPIADQPEGFGRSGIVEGTGSDIQVAHAASLIHRDITKSANEFAVSVEGDTSRMSHHQVACLVTVIDAWEPDVLYTIARNTC